MSAEFSFADEAKVIGDSIIPKYHEHLRGVRVEYVFTDAVIKTKGKELLGRAKKKSGLDAFLAAEVTDDDPQPFFVIEISKPAWDLLDKSQREALVDHELCHCLWDVDKGIFMRAHDVEEFSEIIKRRGLWNPGVQLFAEIAARHVKQIDLPMNEPKVSKVKIAKAGAVAGNGKIVDEGKGEPAKPALETFKQSVAKKRGARAGVVKA